MRIPEDEVYKAALSKFGLKNQTVKCIEELSELQKELCKYFIGQGHLENIIEEIADVEIMLAQVKIGLSISDNGIVAIKNEKLHRLLGLLGLNKDQDKSIEQSLETKCKQCRYTVLTAVELAELDSDPCDTCHSFSNWKPKGEA